MKKYQAIPYLTLNRAVSRFTQDGLLSEQLNCARRGGNILRPVGDKSVVHNFTTNLADYDILYRHPVLPNSDLVGVRTGIGEFHRIMSNSHSSPGPDTIEIEVKDNRGFAAATEEATGITHLGNILILSTVSARYYFRYDPVADSYTQLFDPPVPQFYISMDSSRSESPNLTEKPSFAEAYADYVEAIANAATRGLYEGHSLFRLAWRLSDGSYIAPSAPVHAHIGAKALNYTQSDDSTTADHKFQGIMVGAPELGLILTQADLNKITTWSGEIVSLCVFMTRPVSHYAVSSTEEEYDGSTGTTFYPPINTDALTTLMESEVNYYLVHECYLEDLATNMSEIPIHLGNLGTMPTRTSLPVDQNTLHQVSGRTSTQYNARLHLGCTTTTLYEGYVQDNMLPEVDMLSMYTRLEGFTRASNTRYTIYTYTYIHTEHGEKVVRSADYSPYIWSDGVGSNVFAFQPMLCYPDFRATKQSFYSLSTSGDDTGTYYYLGTINLKPHEFTNFAFYEGLYQGAIEPIVIDITSGTTVTIGNLPTISASYVDHNRIQVSQPNNPFIYPAENSYRIGSIGRSVLSIKAVTEAVSQGQFGQFPLYVFSEEGIWTLSQGDGSTLYAAANAISPDVPLSDNLITSTSNGVAYATSRGVYLLSGSQIKEISIPLEGPIDNPLSSKDDYAGYLGDVYLTEIYDHLCTMRWQDYLAGAIMGYDPTNREIIISYPSEDSIGSASGQYSYVYSIEGNEWYTISRSFIAFINNYPDTWGVDFDTAYSLATEEEADREILIQTRPMAIGAKTFKKITALVQNGLLEVSPDRFAGLYLYGSQDGLKWHLLAGKQQGNTMATMSLRRVDQSCRFYIIVLSASLSLDSMIDAVDVEYTDRFATKLR